MSSPLPPQPPVHPPYGNPYAAQAPALPYGDPVQALLRPARRAGLILFIAAALGMLFAGLIFLSGAFVTSPQFASQPSFQEMLSSTGATAEQVQIGLYVLAVVVGIGALALAGAGIFVRRGTRAAVITAMAVAALPALLWLIGVISSLRAGQAAGLILYGPLLILFVWLYATLRKALAAAAPLRQWRDYLAYYHYYYARQQPYPPAPPLTPAYPPSTTTVTPAPPAPSVPPAHPTTHGPLAHELADDSFNPVALPPPPPPPPHNPGQPPA